MSIYQDIKHAVYEGKRLLAVLIDPEKVELNTLSSFLEVVNNSIVTHIFVGGSTDSMLAMPSVVKEIKKNTQLPVLIFPGSAQQVVPQADGLLFLSLLSGRNPEYLIEQQVASALSVYKSNIEVIPTGYLLIDGGKESSIQKVTQTKPISNKNESLILQTALAGQYLGKKLIYLEAGSGATIPVSASTIKTVKKALSIPIVVGGGIRTKKQLEQAYEAGADLVVIGTAIENDISFFDNIKNNKVNIN